MLELRNNNRVIIQLNPDGSIFYGDEYSAQDAAHCWWELMAPIIAKSQVNYVENGVEQVSISIDGNTITFKSGYQPTPEALVFWKAVRETAPWKKS